MQGFDEFPLPIQLANGHQVTHVRGGEKLGSPAAHLRISPPDKKQVIRVEEARALKEAGITALFLGPFWAKLTFWDGAAWLVTRWPKDRELCTEGSGGTCAEIKQNGWAVVFTL